MITILAVFVFGLIVAITALFMTRLIVMKKDINDLIDYMNYNQLMFDPIKISIENMDVEMITQREIDKFKLLLRNNMTPKVGKTKERAT